VKAAYRERYGRPQDVLEVREVDVPIPVEDQVLVRVTAASVNRADLDVLTAKPWITRFAYGVRRPRDPRLGADVAGVVDEVGPAATRFKPGDRVFADLFVHGMGAFAEHASAPERAFEPIPDGITDEMAATLPHSAILAIQSLRSGSRTVGDGDRVLVDGASGNVGPFAVQIAKARGAVVTGVASGPKLDFVRSLGVDQVIDYREVDYTTTGERWDWIVDTDSHHPILSVRRALRPNGVYVTLGGSGGDIAAALALGGVVTAATSRRMGLMLGWKPFKHEDVAILLEMVARGEIVPRIDRRYPFTELVEALRYVDERRSSGKVMLTF
jgi:NADPH:quinone reductase-like Zn-dependent oxidoreductase